MVLNIDKTYTMLIGSNYSIKSNYEINLRIQGINIKQVKEAKVLRITVDHKLAWSKHIVISTKMARAITNEKKILVLSNT